MLEAAREAFAARINRIRARLPPGTILARQTIFLPSLRAENRLKVSARPQSGGTGLRAGKRNWRPRVFHHDDSAIFMIEPPRGNCVAEGFPGAFRPGFWAELAKGSARHSLMEWPAEGSDRPGGEMGWAKKDNQVCLARLIGGVRYAIDAGGGIFAPGLPHLLGRARRIGRRRDKLADVTLKTYAARLDARLDELIRRAPTHQAGVKLPRVIKKIRRQMFVFAANRAIPAANNGSGRALRPCVTFRKITSGFRTEWGARLYAGIRSVIETARRRAINALEAIRLTLAGKPLATAP